MTDPHNLMRFVEAQNPIFPQVRTELREGCKRTHWMWFIFPQLKGLGHSATAHKFAISSREEAAAYLKHSILGPRLEECTQLVDLVEGRSAHQIFGTPDDLKFHSSMTLFSKVTTEGGLFHLALKKFFGGEPDGVTLEKLQSLPQ